MPGWFDLLLLPAAWGDALWVPTGWFAAWWIAWPPFSRGATPRARAVGESRSGSRTGSN